MMTRAQKWDRALERWARWFRFLDRHPVVRRIIPGWFK